MKVIKNKILPIGKKYYAINICGMVFAKGDCNSTVINHEKIHTRQMLELLIIGFYLWYLIEWLIRVAWLRNMFSAYKSISFEREAYANQHNLHYLKTRRPYSFLHHLTKK